MFGKTLELREKICNLNYNLRIENRRVSGLLENIASLQKKISEKNVHQLAMHALDIEKAKNDIRKSMEKSLIESDLRRVEAVAKLNTYIDMDTKDERKHIQEMLKDAIKGLSSKPEITVNNK